MTSPATSARVAMVAACWHADIVDRAVEGFVTQLESIDVQVDVYRVPGAFELPLFVRRVAKSGRYDAVATAALVVDGGIYRHDFVAHTVVEGLMQIQLEMDVPVFSGVLTPHHFHEHDFHREQFSGHFATKGHGLAEAVHATLAAFADLAGDREPV